MIDHIIEAMRSVAATGAHYSISLHPRTDEAFDAACAALEQTNVAPRPGFDALYAWLTYEAETWRVSVHPPRRGAALARVLDEARKLRDAERVAQAMADDARDAEVKAC